MALATRCPNCSAIFRVGAEQLTSRGGMVRCGSCHHVFNAMGRLDYIEPTPGSAESSATRGGAPAPPEVAKDRRRHARPPLAATPARAPTTPSVGPARSPPPVANKAPAAAPKALAPASPEVPPPPGESPVIHGLSALSPPGPPPVPSAAPRIAVREPPALEGSGNAPPAPPAPGAAELVDDVAIAELEPDFLRSPRTESSRLVRVALAAGCAFLVPALAVQLALLFRSSLILHFPDLQPTLAALCAPLSCSAQWPMRPELLAVVSSDLQAVAGTPALELDAVIRNRAEFPMALPALELTLTDSLNRPVARKVFTPDDYLAGHSAAAPGPSDHLAAGADLSIRLVFEFRGLGVAGFVAYPFYP